MLKIGTPSRSVLLVGDNDLAGLACVRALGRAGYSVDVLSQRRSSIAGKSRFTRRVHHIAPSGALPAAICDLNDQEAYDVILPVSEAVVASCMPFHEELQSRCNIVLPSASNYALFADKWLTYQLAETCGAPVPRSLLLKDHQCSLDQIEEAVGGYPIVLKPTVSRPLRGTSPKNIVQFVDCRNDLASSLQAWDGTTALIAQEFIRGRGVGVCVLANRGEIIQSMQMQYLHEPPSGGICSYRQTEALDSSLLAQTSAMVREAAWHGPALFEFMRRDSNGATVLSEVNGRLWGALPLATAAGVNFPVQICELYLDQIPPSVSEYPVPVFARNIDRDLRFLVKWILVNEKNWFVRRPNLRELAVDTCRMFGRSEHWDVEWWTDLRPAVAAWSDALRALWNRKG